MKRARVQDMVAEVEKKLRLLREIEVTDGAGSEEEEAGSVDSPAREGAPFGEGEEQLSQDTSREY